MNIEIKKLPIRRKKMKKSRVNLNLGNSQATLLFSRMHIMRVRNLNIQNSANWNQTHTLKVSTPPQKEGEEGVIENFRNHNKVRTCKILLSSS